MKKFIFGFMAMAVLAFGAGKYTVCSEGTMKNRITGEITSISEKDTEKLFKFKDIGDGKLLIAGDSIFELERKETSKRDDGVAYTCYTQPNGNKYCFYETGLIRIVFKKMFVELDGCRTEQES